MKKFPYSLNGFTVDMARFASIYLYYHFIIYVCACVCVFMSVSDSLY